MVRVNRGDLRNSVSDVDGLNKVIQMPIRIKRVLFLMFFVSGFCGLAYQVVWLRFAFAAFGVITPVISLVVSVFMLGLGLGSWVGGHWIGRVTRTLRVTPVFVYGMVELIIGAGAFAVPRLFRLGAHLLLNSGDMDSTSYLLLSAIIITISMLPWCTCMGATFPCMMAYFKELDPEHRSSFSFLYLGNVIGAIAGVISTGAFLVEVFGLSGTLTVAAALNGLISATSITLGFRGRDNSQRTDTIPVELQRPAPGATVDPGWLILAPSILVTTGFSSMAMEVVWTRAFTPVTRTTIYAFVLLLATYLMGTAYGSLKYRRHLLENRTISPRNLLAFLAIAAFLPLFVNDPRLSPTPIHVIFSLLPLCAGLGYLTPSLIDSCSQGSPERAGKLYALNIIGSIVGPLLAGYILLPFVGVKWALILLTLPFTFMLLGYVLRFSPSGRTLIGWSVLLSAMLVLCCFTWTFEDRTENEGGLVYRDYTATVCAEGQGRNKQLLVNGVGMTMLTPITKVMAHLPLASLPHEPKSMLIICFGMGTTYRSALSWGIDVRAVELVPGVKRAFGYFFEDAADIVDNPKGRIVIDDGRRYLQRTEDQFDVITLDPPPPIEAAGSSLLYSEEFYGLVKAHLRKGGILQQWFPSGEDKTLWAVVATLDRSYPYVRVFHSIEGWGYHLLASESPIEVPDAPEMMARMPQQAQKDLMEWFPDRSVPEVIAEILKREVKTKAFENPQGAFCITDSRPFNEYYLIRRLLALWNGTYRLVS